MPGKNNSFERRRADELDAQPLFYRRRRSPTGECEEISLGPSVVCIFRHLLILLLAVLFLLAGVEPAGLLRFVLRLWP